MQPPLPPGQPPAFHGNRPNMNPQMNMQRPPFPPVPDLQMLQSLFPFPALGQNPVEFFTNFLRTQAMGHGGWYHVTTVCKLKVKHTHHQGAALYNHSLNTEQLR